MEKFLDREVHRSPLRDVDTGAKLLLVVGSLLAVTASPSPVPPLLALLLFSSLALGPGGARPKLFFGLLSLPLLFGGATFLYLALLTGEGPPLWSIEVTGQAVGVTATGLDRSLLVLTRFLGGTSGLLFLALTTPPFRIFGTLRRLGLPNYLTETAYLVYRYSFLLLDEAVTMRRAQGLRGGHGSLRSSLTSLPMLAGGLLVGTHERGRSLDAAMRSRGFPGEVPELGEEASAKTRAAALLLLGLLICVAYVTRSLGATDLLGI